MKSLESTLTPWEVRGTVPYEHWTSTFGMKEISSELLKRWEEITGMPPCFLLKRKIFFAHQDLDTILEEYAAGKEIYIYTGRGPSSESLHLGHWIPLQLTVWLQQIFHCWVVIEMSDEEKFYFKEGSLEEFLDYTEGNAKDMIACGLDPEKTFIFSSFKYETYMRPLIAQINKKMSVHMMNRIYGFEETHSVGQVQWPAYQMAPALCGAFPHLFGDRKEIRCLIPCAIDQTPYFRSLRSIAKSLGYPKPSLICSKFLISLQGASEKASSTGSIPPLFFHDTDREIEFKIRKYAFSGGKDTIQEHRLYGADLSVDVPYIYLYHFMEDEKELKRISEEYRRGSLLTGEIKKILEDLVKKFLSTHRKKRAEVTQELYTSFFTMRIQPEAAKAFLKFREKYLQIPYVFSWE